MSEARIRREYEKIRAQQATDGVHLPPWEENPARSEYAIQAGPGERTLAAAGPAVFVGGLGVLILGAGESSAATVAGMVISTGRLVATIVSWLLYRRLWLRAAELNPTSSGAIEDAARLHRRSIGSFALFTLGFLLLGAGLLFVLAGLAGSVVEAAIVGLVLAAAGALVLVPAVRVRRSVKAVEDSTHTRLLSSGAGGLWAEWGVYAGVSLVAAGAIVATLGRTVT